MRWPSPDYPDIHGIGIPLPLVSPQAGGDFPHYDKNEVGQEQDYEANEEQGAAGGQKDEPTGEDHAAKQDNHDGDLEVEGLLPVVIDKGGAVLAHEPENEGAEESCEESEEMHEHPGAALIRVRVIGSRSCARRGRGDSLEGGRMGTGRVIWHVFGWWRGWRLGDLWGSRFIVHGRGKILRWSLRIIVS